MRKLTPEERAEREVAKAQRRKKIKDALGGKRPRSTITRRTNEIFGDKTPQPTRREMLRIMFGGKRLKKDRKRKPPGLVAGSLKNSRGT